VRFTSNEDFVQIVGRVEKGVSFTMNPLDQDGNFILVKRVALITVEWIPSYPMLTRLQDMPALPEFLAVAPFLS